MGVSEMRKSIYLTMIIFLVLLSKYSVAAVDKIDALTVIDNTMECVDCPDWHPVGICFWLKCSLFSCDVEESPKIHENLPDLLISTYTTTQSPIDITDGINDVNNANLTNKDESPSELETYIDYKHAEVFTNPTVAVFNAMHDADDEYFCKSGVDIPYFPHFLSSQDPNWDDPDIEAMLGALFGLISTPRIRTNWPLGYWATVYPRCGWGSHPYDAINAAVAAHRAAAIATSDFAPHIYLRPGTDCGNRCWQPQPVRENDSNNHQFQMVFPVKETSGMVMGGEATWANGKNKKSEEGYAWTLWRPYECCKKKGQSFLFSIDW